VIGSEIWLPHSSNIYYIDHHNHVVIFFDEDTVHVTFVSVIGILMI